MNRSSAVGFPYEYLAIIVTGLFTDVGEHGLLVSSWGECKSNRQKPTVHVSMHWKNS